MFKPIGITHARRFQFYKLAKSKLRKIKHALWHCRVKLSNEMLSLAGPHSLGSLLKLTLPTMLSVAAFARLHYANFLDGEKYWKKIHRSKAGQCLCCHGSWVTDKPEGAELEEVTEGKKPKVSFFPLHPFFSSTKFRLRKDEHHKAERRREPLCDCWRLPINHIFNYRIQDKEQWQRVLPPPESLDSQESAVSHTHAEDEFREHWDWHNTTQEHLSPPQPQKPAKDSS